MAGYIRQDVTNNIADGNVINASDFDNEYNAIEAAFHATTGHTHDGTSAEGAPITKIGPTQDVVASASALTPKTDNTVDLGSSTLEYKDLWIDGTANIDSLVADTADINGGTIDGVTIGGASAGAATFTTVAATTGNITTVNATTVDTTNIEVTTLKAKDGTSAGSIADSTGVVTLASSVLTTTDINGGTIDGVTIGGASAGVGTFTTMNATTVDTTNIEVTNIKAKDGTAAASIADATGIITVSSQLNVDNLNLSGNTLSSTDANGNIVLAPNGTGDVQLDADTVRIGDANANATLTTNGTGDLILNTNAGTNSGSITIADAANGDISLAPNGNGSVVITNAGTSNALRITQTGSGNALLVEDSANPDATPFVVDSIGRVLAGTPTALNVSGEAGFEQLQITSTTSLSRWTAASSGPNFTFAKSRSGTIGTNTIVQDSDSLGVLAFNGADGTSFISGARIQALVDGTPGTNDMPGRLVFSTTADGASSPTERVRIDSAGNVGIGTTANAQNKLIVGGVYPSGSSNTLIISAEGTIPSSSTNIVQGFRTQLTTQAASFTLATLSHFYASQAALGAGSALVTQYGFLAESSLTGATTNYGFFSNIASGTGRWNFYANGSADNYFGGSLALGGTTTPGASGMSLRVGLPMTGVSNEWVGILNNGQVRSGVTGNAYMYRSVLDTQAASFTLTNHYHYYASQSSIGAGSAVTNQYGFVVDSTVVGATNNYGFFGAVPSGTGRWNFYASGTADNFFGGPTTISVNSSSNALRITQTGAGNALVVEDSANPDASPFVVNNTGQVLIGNTTSVSYQSMGLSYTLGAAQITGADGNSSSQLIAQYNTGSSVAIPTLVFAKSKNATVGAHTLVASGDSLGAISYDGSDGTNFIEAARVWAQVDGTPGTNDMPGRLIFSTTADGASTPTERMRIDSAGQIGIGANPSAGYTLNIAKNVTGSVNSGNIVAAGTTQSDVTSNSKGFATFLGTQAASFTLTNLVHFEAQQGTIGASSAITNQYGYFAAATLIGATNNYGFYSNIASGSGRWNFYANGTAQNYFAGNTLIGTTTNTNSSALVVNGSISETVSSVQYLVASQYDVGTDPNEIPVNGNLGALAFMDSQFQQLAVGTGITGGTGTICKTSSGMEGGISVTRILIDLTGLNSGGTAGDIIGVNGTANPCYILALPSVTVLGGRMTCLEAPAGGDTDIDLYSATEGTGVEDQAITALTETQLINGGVQALGTTTYFAADPTFNGYLYLVGQGTANATYTAGRFLIEIFGVQP